MLGSFYEKAWEFGRQIDASSECATTTPRRINKAGASHRKRMHLRQSEEGVSALKSVDASPGTIGLPKEPLQRESRQRQNVEFPDEVGISLPEELDVATVLDRYFASWILFLHRYHKDGVDQFSWTTSVSNGFYALTFGGLDLSSLHSVADLLNAVRSWRPQFKLTNLATLPCFGYRDGVDEEASSNF